MNFFFNSDLKIAGIGLVFLLLTSLIDYKHIKKLSYLGIIVAIALLAYVVIFGTDIRGTKRWIYFGRFSFQPVEFAKIALIVYFANILDSFKSGKLKSNDKTGFIFLLLPLAICTVLVMLQPNLSSAFIMIFPPLLMWFMSKENIKILFATLSLGAVGVFYKMFLKGYGLQRVVTFLNPLSGDLRGEKWQVANSLFAMGLGRVWGNGIGLSTQNKLYIPDPQNDFILSTLGDELGLLGTVGLLIIYLLWIHRMFKITINAPDFFSSLVGLGISTMLSIQILLNYAVATSSVPVTGVSLPLVSHGGSSLLVVLTSIGVMLGLSTKTKE